MSFLQTLIVNIVMKLADKLADFVIKKAQEVSNHNKDQHELRTKAKKVEQSANRVKNAISENKKVTKEMADALNERNRRLRSGKLT